MKKLGSMLLVMILLCTTLPATCLTAGNDFTDVPADAWYYNDVKKAVDKGLINGKTASSYAPEDNLTYAEAVKLAACMYKLSTEGNVDFEQSSPWYMTFVEYAKANSIILKDYDWEKKATRAEYMDIFSKALPSGELNEVNSVPDNAIPDVPMTHPSAHSIYKMYRAGIVQGSDAQYSCKPAENIKRSEVAAILTRMMDTNARKSFTITIPAYRTLYNTGYTPYDAKINEYYQAMSADDNAFDRNDDSSINGLMVGYARGYGGALYYTLYDVNKNGVPELMFSNGSNIIDIYTLNNGSLVKIFENCYFGERSRLHILTDGTLLTEGSGGASTGSYETFKLNGNGSLESTGAYYYNSDGPDAYMKGYTYISAYDYGDKVSNYLSYSVFNSLDLKLFADMNEIIQKRCYHSATISMKNGEYLYAADQFSKAGNYKDAGTMATECYYQYGIKQMGLNYVTEGIKYLSMCRGYKDADEYVLTYYYDEAKTIFNAYMNTKKSFDGGYTPTYETTLKALKRCEGYGDSEEMISVLEVVNGLWLSAKKSFKMVTAERPAMAAYTYHMEGFTATYKNNTITLYEKALENAYNNQNEATIVTDYNKSYFKATVKHIFTSVPWGEDATDITRCIIAMFTENYNDVDLLRYIEGKAWEELSDGYQTEFKYGGYNFVITSSHEDYGYTDLVIEANVKSNSSTKSNTSAKTNTSINTTVQKPAKEEPVVETPPVVEVPKAETREHDCERVCNYCHHDDGTINMTLKNGVKTDVKWKCSSCDKENWNYVTLRW